MVSIAINVAWFLIGVIALAGILYFAMWVIETFIHPIPSLVKQAVMVIFLLLVFIALLTALTGGGGLVRLPSFR